MASSKHRYRSWLWVLWLVLLLLPALQQFTGLVPQQALHGDGPEEATSAWSVERWFSGEFQKEKNEESRQKFGFRPTGVRVYNQVHYSLYDNPRAKTVVMGKEGYLYEQAYLDAYTGKDFKGGAFIENRCRLTRDLKDSLESRGVDLLVVLAPCKARYFPEHLPAGINEADSTNYQPYVEAFAKQGISVLNVHEWFLELRRETPYPLMTKNGIHWSHYGELLVGDSIARYMDETMSIPMAKLSIADGELSSDARYRDQDIEDGMNLLFDIPEEPMYYPEFSFNAAGAQAPRVLCISDSYYWGLFELGYSKQMFDNGEFWYYGNVGYGPYGERDVRHLNVLEELEDVDAVIIMTTVFNLNRFAFGFLDRGYDAFHPEGVSLTEAYEQKVLAKMNEIRNTPDWLQAVTAQAEREGISIERSIRNNAEYVLSQE